MLRKFGTRTNILEKIQDPNLISAGKRFPNFTRRANNIEPIRLYPDKFLYLRNRSISAGETHGANQNGDFFPRQELKKSYSTFIGCPVTIDHNESLVVGMILDSVWVPKQIFKQSDKRLIAFQPEMIESGDQIVGDWVENILAIDKTKADITYSALRGNSDSLTERILDGDVHDSSMGTFVQYSICSVPGCRHKAAYPEEYCQHVASYKTKVIAVENDGKILTGDAANGKSRHQVYEENYGLTFFEDSIILPSHLGGTAGGEGADIGAKLLQQVASKQTQVAVGIDLAPYTIHRTEADLKKEAQMPGYNTMDYVEMGDTPESVEKGEEHYDKAKENEAEESQVSRLEEKVRDIVKDVETQIEELKSLVVPEQPEKSEADVMLASKRLAQVELRSNNAKDFKEALTSITQLGATITTHQIHPNSFFASLSLPKSKLPKVTKLINTKKDYTIHIVESTKRSQSMNKGDLITFKAKVAKIFDKQALFTLDKVEMPVSNRITSALQNKLSTDKLIAFASGKTYPLSSLRIKLAENDEIKEGDEVEVPGTVAEVPTEEGASVTITLDVDATSEIEGEELPVTEVIVPEDQVEVEESEPEEDSLMEVPEEEEAFDMMASKKKSTGYGGKKKKKMEKEESLTEDIIQASINRVKAQNGPGEPKPKDKVPDAGGNSAPGAGTSTPSDSALQGLHDTKENTKVPNAGNNGPNSFTTSGGKTVAVNEDTIQAAINKVKASKRNADYPEEMSYEGNTGTIPKDKSNAPEKNFAEPFPKDKSSEPDNNVTTLSSKVKQLTIANAKLQRALKEVQASAESYAKKNKELVARLKPLEVEAVIASMLRANQLDPNAVEDQTAELNQIYDNDQAQFAAIKLVTKQASQRFVRSSKRTTREALNNQRKANNLEVSDIVTSNPSKRVGNLEDCTLFDED